MGRRLWPTVGERLLFRVLAACAVFVFVGAGVTDLAAARPLSAPGNNWYVSLRGSDSGNPCSVKARPCLTLAHALAQQGAAAVGGMIHVATGTFAQAGDAIKNLVAGNSNVTIRGFGSRTIIDPPLSDWADGTPVDLTGPATGVTVSNLEITAKLGGVFPCPTDSGVVISGASDSLVGVAVTGASCGDGVDVTGASDATLTDVTTPQPKCSTTTKVDIPVGTDLDGYPLILAKKPCALFGFGGSLLLGGMSGSPNYAATYAGAGKAVYFTTSQVTTSDIPAGTTVNLAPASPAYAFSGINCGAGATCTITGGSITGSGPTDVSSETGITVASGALFAQIGGCGAFNATTCTTPGDPVTVSGNLNSLGVTTDPGTGIAVEKDAHTVDIIDNAVTNNDLDISAVDSGGVTPATWTINGNTASRATSTGIQLLDEVASTNATLVVQGNKADTEERGGVGVFLGGVQGQLDIGGSGTSEGNEIDGTSVGVGLVLGNSPVAPHHTTSGNTIENNTVTDNGIGVEIGGVFAPTALGGSQIDNSGNHFIGNTWSANALVNVVDFTAFAPPGASPPAQYVTAGGMQDNEAVTTLGAGIPTESIATSAALSVVIPPGHILGLGDSGSPGSCASTGACSDVVITGAPSPASSFSIDTTQGLLSPWLPTQSYPSGSTVHVNPFQTGAGLANTYSDPGSPDPAAGTALATGYYTG